MDESIFSGGRKSLAVADLEKSAVEIPIQNGLIDWVSVLIRGDCK